jgi:hypothetical protein
LVQVADTYFVDGDALRDQLAALGEDMDEHWLRELEVSFVDSVWAEVRSKYNADVTRRLEGATRVAVGDAGYDDWARSAVMPNFEHMFRENIRVREAAVAAVAATSVAKPKGKAAGAGDSTEGGAGGDGGSAGAGAGGPTVVLAPGKGKGKRALEPNWCTFQMAGTCTKGATCRFDHRGTGPNKR